MEYNEYLEKHSDKILHYCVPVKPGTKVLVRNEWTTDTRSSNEAEYLPAIVVRYLISRDVTNVELYIEEYCLTSVRPITDFGKSIFINDPSECERYELEKRLDNEKSSPVFADEDGNILTLQDVMNGDIESVYFIKCNTREEYSKLKELYDWYGLVCPEPDPLFEKPHFWFWDDSNYGDWSDLETKIAELEKLKGVYTTLQTAK